MGGGGESAAAQPRAQRRRRSLSAAAQPGPLAQPRPAAIAAQPDERAGVLNFLGETIAWYRQLATEDRLATEPAETLFVDDDRQMALESGEARLSICARGGRAVEIRETSRGRPVHPDERRRRAGEDRDGRRCPGSLA